MSYRSQIRQTAYGLGMAACLAAFPALGSLAVSKLIHGEPEADQPVAQTACDNIRNYARRSDPLQGMGWLFLSCIIPIAGGTTLIKRSVNEQFEGPARETHRRLGVAAGSVNTGSLSDFVSPESHLRPPEDHHPQI